MAFIHRFGASLNPHTHFHVCVIDGVFEPDPQHGVRFFAVEELDGDDAEAVQTQVRHRYYGVLAPNAPLRAAVTALAPEAIALLPSPPAETSGEEPFDAPHRSPARYLWAMLLARIYEALPLTCPRCGSEMRTVAFITEVAPVQRILNHIGEPVTPPRVAPARGPPQWDDSGAVFLDEDRLAGDSLAQPEPDFEFDQRISW